MQKLKSFLLIVAGVFYGLVTFNGSLRLGMKVGEHFHSKPLMLIAAVVFLAMSVGGFFWLRRIVRTPRNAWD
ncbi:hypothetical protein [Pseudomonas sp. TMW22089]|uniref:hypothetical protein n=1 Tax=Pseudomonas sp. TMW22089 TaxID=2506433 RepID=UPI001F0E8922|nr:hypothetical protein [Pseudomonas sp. TMW22089]MCH4870671.1 hypothetical protein [Pseudomonas sp. TMW22089]